MRLNSLLWISYARVSVCVIIYCLDRNSERLEYLIVDRVIPNAVLCVWLSAMSSKLHPRWPAVQ